MLSLGGVWGMVGIVVSLAAIVKSQGDPVSTTEVSSVISPRPSVESGGVCNSTICKEVSRRMLDIMDPRDIDPCEDFYQYSCGGVLDDPFLKPEDPKFVADNIIKESLISGDRNDPDLQELFVMYDSCLNYSGYNKNERLTEARKAFEELGYKFNPMSIKIYEDTHPSEPRSFDLTKALADMMTRHFAPFFDIIIDVSKENKSEFSLKMVLPSFGSAFSYNKTAAVCLDEYKNKATDAKQNGKIFDVNEHYKNYTFCTMCGSGLRARIMDIRSSMDELGLLDFIEDESISGRLRSQSTVELDILLYKLADVTPPTPEIRKAILNKDYEEVTVANIDNGEVFGELPINMQKLLEALLEYPINPDQLKIQVYFKEVFKQYFDIIYDTYDWGEPVLQNMMLLLWMEHIYDDLVNPSGPAAGSTDYCIKVVTSYMDDYVTLLYLGELSERNALESEMRHMIDLTLTLMKTQLKDSKLESRQDFAKMESMTGKVATLEHSREVLQENKRDIPMTLEKDDFTSNYMTLMKNYRKRMYFTYREVTNTYKSLWIFLQFPYMTTGGLSYGLGTFLIPHGAMSPPYYYEGVPFYINYAGIGHMIAHEILHAFDATGMKFDGPKRMAMEEDSILIEGISCLQQQLSKDFFFNSSTGSQYSFKLEADLNINELLADIAATNLAWDAYIKDLRTMGVSFSSVTTTSPQPKIAVTVSDSETPTTLYDQTLHHWEETDILQMYFIKIAQNHCSSTGELDILKVMENEHLPPKLRVNLGVKNNKLFRKAFNCPSQSDTAVDSTEDICSFSPMGYH